eukprot:scaffold5810_cov112-Isochrysis_galbana.AAC.3
MNSRKSQLGRYWEDFLSSRRSSAGIAKISGACACLASGRLVGTLSSNFSSVLCGVTLRRCAAQMSGAGVKTSHSMGGARADRAAGQGMPR